MRTLVAALASLGLVVAISAIPAAAATCAAASDAAASEDASLSFAGAFICTDAADSGTWSITVSVTNDSDAELTISAVELTHVTPSLAADAAAAASVTGSSLPLTVAAGAAGSFEVAGDYTLAQLGDSALLNVHLQATGVAAGAPATLAVNVHLLGPGVELEEAEAEVEVLAGARAEVADERSEDGKPDWLPGPPPWVIALLADLHPDGFPWGSDAFPPDIDADAAGAAATSAGDETSADAAAGAGAAVDVGPPAHVQFPPQAAAAAAARAGGDAGAEAGDDATIEISAGASGRVIVAPIGGE